MRKHILVVRTAMLVLALAAISFAADDPFTGTWKMNAEKSKYDPGPPPKSLALQIVADDNGIKIINDRVGADGKPNHSEGSFICDGREHAATEMAETYAATRNDAGSIEIVYRKDGNVVNRSRMTVSKDGKTLTNTFDRGSASTVVVLDRQ